VRHLSSGKYYVGSPYKEAALVSLLTLRSCVGTQPQSDVGCIVFQLISHLLNLCSTASRLLSHHSALNVTPTSRYAVGS
jgi:hypothetical protein